MTSTEQHQNKMSNQGPSKITDMPASNKENIIPICVVRPRFRIRPGRNKYHRPRHHNPGTHYRPDPRLHRHPDRRIRLLSSVKVVPPPIPADQSPCNKADHTTYRRPLIGEIDAQWRKPKMFNLSPVRSAWKKERELVPAPTVDYRHGFDVFPGPAYQPVVWYENREVTFPPVKIDLPQEQRPRIHDTLGQDPRSIDLRVRLEKLRIGDLRDKLNIRRAEKRNRPPETPEQAVARLHGEIPNDPLAPMAWPRSQAHQVPRPLAPEPPTWPNHQHQQPTWPGPIRRRRRCRLIIIEEPTTPASNTHPEGGTK